jgi:hypothetical protein
LLHLSDPDTELTQLRQVLTELIHPEFELELRDLGDFNSSVVFAQTAQKHILEGLHEAVKRLIPAEMKFSDSKDFSPHCTLFKGGKINLSNVERSRSRELGTTPVRRLSVLKMGGNAPQYQKMFELELIPFEELRFDDTMAALELEELCFPPDEAADLEGIRMRQKNAGEYFFSAKKGEIMIGMINGTVSNAETLTHDR